MANQASERAATRRGSGRPDFDGEKTIDARQQIDIDRPDVFEQLPSHWRRLPCHYINDEGRCSCGNGACASPGKHPRTKHGVKDATSDRGQILAWYDANRQVNWALATGAESKVWVLDADAGKGGLDSLDEVGRIVAQAGETVPPTLVAQTGGGGLHYYFEHPGGRIGNRVNVLPGLDVRGDGGYVLLPPSNHISGGRYLWRRTGTRPLPASSALLNLVRNAAGSNLSGPASTPFNVTDAEAMVTGLGGAGGRNDTMHRLASRWWRKYGTDADHIVYELARRAIAATPDTSGLDELELVGAIESARRFIKGERSKEVAAIRALSGGAR
ncbi:bifunctional DNA primase/polymerase [Agromyces sp. GXS1127]|uniref:bifunctional DNA primase/polymerase n=1 Tax=Agromyces sp. GXS1127 TaxID=3424181 RepID=UPI003D318CF7